MSAPASPKGPDSTRLDDFIMSTPASQRNVSFLDGFSRSDLNNAFERACGRFRLLSEQRSRSDGELRSLTGPFNSLRDEESLAFFVRSIAAEEFVETFCDHGGKEKIEGLSLGELKKWTMVCCNDMDELVADVEALEAEVRSERARQGGRKE